MAGTPFAIEVQTIETKRAPRAVVIDETYRPIFDKLSKLADDQEVVLTFDDEATADKAKATVQALAKAEGYTARERRGMREVHEDGTVTLRMTKRPKPVRETDADTALPEADAPAE